MRHLITGATGYIGGRLAPRLLDEEATGKTVRCLVRDPGKLRDVPWAHRVEVVRGDLLDPESVRRACEGVDVVYFLVHSLVEDDFADARPPRRDDRGRGPRARPGCGGSSTSAACTRTAPLSTHLASRARSGEILLASGVPTAVLQAAVVIGSGSASFEMLRYLTERLPVMVTPRWVGNRIQPIAVRDVLRYLVGAARLPAEVNRTFDIGGPDVLTYREMMQPLRRGRRPAQASRAAGPGAHPAAVGALGQPRHAGAEGDRQTADRLAGARGGVPRARHRSSTSPTRRRAGSATTAPSSSRWRRSAPGTSRRGGPTPPAPAPPRTRSRPTRDWAGGTVYLDVREQDCRADPEALWRVVTGIGGERGWYSFPLAWSVRGWLDRLVGGVGLRRGRRDPNHLHIGDALDWWRVERSTTGSDGAGPRCCACAREMKVPGRAWLEMSVDARRRRLALPPARGVPAPRAGRAPVLVGRRAVPRRGLRRHGPQHHAHRGAQAGALVAPPDSACRRAFGGWCPAAIARPPNAH